MQPLYIMCPKFAIGNIKEIFQVPLHLENNFIQAFAALPVRSLFKIDLFIIYLSNNLFTHASTFHPPPRIDHASTLTLS